MIRVFIVDDSPIARVVLSKMVNAAPDMEVVGTAVNGEEALTMIPQLRPQVILTDLHMPKMDGLALTREVMVRHPLPILVVSVSVHQNDNDNNIFELLEAGLPPPDKNKLLVTGIPQDLVVKAVIEGRVDVGFLRSGMLEEMTRPPIDPEAQKLALKLILERNVND